MVSVVRARVRALVSALACVLLAAGLSQLAAAPAQAAPPNIIGPVGGETVPQIPNLQWQRLPDAAKYDVQVSTSDTFGSRLVDTNTVNSQYTPTVQLPAGDLWWRVRVTGSGDAGWATATFKRAAIAAPTMLGPTGVLTQPASPPLISWTSVPGATQYNLQVSTDENFTDPTKITNYTPTKTTSAINPVLVAPNIYYARVQAVLSGGINTAFSPAHLLHDRGTECRGADQPAGGRGRHRHRPRLEAGAGRGDLPAADRRRHQLREPRS